MYSNELHHHGVKGQKWGVRRYQNYDGTLKEGATKKFIARQNAKTAGANLYRVEKKTSNKYKDYRNDVIKKSLSEVGKAEKILGKKEADNYLAEGYRNQALKSAAIRSVVTAGAAVAATMGLGIAADALPEVDELIAPNLVGITGLTVAKGAPLYQVGSKGYRGGTARQRISKMTGRKFYRQPD